MILYPTETLYGLGVNALDERELLQLQTFKGRDITKTTSWLVRSMHDIAYYAVLTKEARILAENLMPGPLTLVLEVKDIIPKNILLQREGTVGFRISSDKNAQKLIANYLQQENAPLTCTSANISDQPTLTTPQEILQQFSSFHKDTNLITRVIDDGQRNGEPSTVVRALGGSVEILRQGSISKDKIEELLGFTV